MTKTGKHHVFTKLRVCMRTCITKKQQLGQNKFLIATYKICLSSKKPCQIIVTQNHSTYASNPSSIKISSSINQPSSLPYLIYRACRNCIISWISTLIAICVTKLARMYSLLVHLIVRLLPNFSPYS